jgi:flagellar biosynthesis GTPase FlhF
LKIYDNKIKKNKASGIAAQYYESAGKIGGVKIKDNTITSNSDYGINCKAPSGGNPGVDYWTKSMEMLANKVYSNKDGEFSETCHFAEEKIVNATRTKKEIEQYSKSKHEAQQKTLAEQEAEKQKTQDEIDKQETEEEHKRKAQEELRKKMQEDKNIQREIEEITMKTSGINNEDIISKEKVESRPSVFIFVIGPDYGELRKMALNIQNYDAKLKRANEKIKLIGDDAIRGSAQKNINSIEKNKKDVYDFVDKYNSSFSLFGWMFREK